jgi:ABC-type cobalamin transport system ATPase subunit
LTVTVCSWSAGVNTVNVVRERQDMQALVDDLVGIGATVVTTEQDLKQTLKDADLKPPLLG